jgi:hypothetical protein
VLRRPDNQASKSDVARPRLQALITDAFARRNLKKLRPHCCTLAQFKAAAQYALLSADSSGLDWHRTLPPV